MFACCFFSLAHAKEKPVIILDAGHGGRDEGAKIRSLFEKKLTLRTCYLTKKHLEALGYRVVLTRARDIFIPLNNRVRSANRRSEAIFISIHYNSAESPSAKGIEVYYYGSGQNARTVSSKKLASTLLNQVLKETSAVSRGVKHGNFQVIRETKMTAVLIEGGFMTNVEERNLLKTQVYLEKIAKGIAFGLDAYLKS